MRAPARETPSELFLSGVLPEEGSPPPSSTPDIIQQSRGPFTGPRLFSCAPRGATRAEGPQTRRPRNRSLERKLGGRCDVRACSPPACADRKFDRNLNEVALGTARSTDVYLFKS